MKPETAKWIFGSLAIILTVWITKEPEYLWALWLLVLSDDKNKSIKELTLL